MQCKGSEGHVLLILQQALGLHLLHRSPQLPLPLLTLDLGHARLLQVHEHTVLGVLESRESVPGATKKQQAEEAGMQGSAR